jgi:hypothetical protein
MATALGAGLLLGGSYLSSRAQRKAANKAAEAQQAANQANIEAHTMTPAEQAQFFNSGVSKINAGYTSGLDTTTRALAARGLGGDSVAAPITRLAGSRTSAIGDLYSDMVKTAMSMKSGTPTLQPVNSGPSTSAIFTNSIGNLMGMAGAYGVGKIADRYFK